MIEYLELAMDLWLKGDVATDAVSHCIGSAGWTAERV